MAFISPRDRVLEQSTSNSQTVFTVTGALDAGYNAFSASMSIGDTTLGAVVEAGVAFKAGLLTYSNTNEVTVTTTLDSKGTFSAGGVKQVFMGMPAAPAAVRAVAGLTRKNYFLNGAMMVSQENGSTAGTASGYYPADQWSVQTSAMGTGTFSAAQVASASPAGSPNRLRLTVTAAQATVGSSLAFLQQKIEGTRGADLLWGSASAKTVTASLGIKAPVAGTYVVQISNAGVTASVSGTVSIAAGEVGVDVTKTVTLAGVTSGTWAIDTTAGLLVQVFAMHASQTANVFATNGNVFELFDVGLYEGSIAPPFTMPDPVSERLLCQRYWEKSYDYATALGTVTSAGADQIFAGTTTSILNIGGISARFKTPKRATPTVTVYSDITGASGKIRDRANGVDLTPTATDSVGEGGFRAYASITAATQIALSCHWTSNARL